MADEKTEEKVKQTVPAMTRSATGIAEHAAAVLAMQWDKDRRVFRDPFTVTLALFTYAKLTATLLHEAEERLSKRINEFETRLTTMERWKNEAEAQTMEMVSAADELMKNGPQGLIDQLNALKQQGSNVVALPSGGGPAPVVDAVVVEDAKPPKVKPLDTKNGS